MKIASFWTFLNNDDQT